MGGKQPLHPTLRLSHVLFTKKTLQKALYSITCLLALYCFVGVFESLVVILIGLFHQHGLSLVFVYEPDFETFITF